MGTTVTEASLRRLIVRREATVAMRTMAVAAALNPFFAERRRENA
jgi:hypothetical protein